MERSCRIAGIIGREIIDSRANPTVECVVRLQSGAVGRASVPSGASTGSFEAHELRDGDPRRFSGRGVLRAIKNIEQKISPELVGMDASQTGAIDAALLELDGNENKKNLGANALLAVSLAAARAASSAMKIPLYRFLGGARANILPIPMMNILNGGAHADNSVDIQEFMVMPVGASTFSEGLRWGVEVYHALGGLLKARGLATGVGDEGGFAPNLDSDEEVLELILEAIEKAGFKAGTDFALALDVAATEWVAEEGGYMLPKSQKIYDSEQLISHFCELVKKYPIISLEDPLGEQDYAGFSEITSRIGRTTMIVGDDLFVTNPQRLGEGIERSAGNAILIKLNQIGTLSETLSVIDMAKNAGFKTIISHRSGETEDTTIADLAVAVGAGFIKTGAPCRTERVCKYNQLLRIEEQLGTSARYGLK